MFEYRYGIHVYSYKKPLEEMTKKELFHLLKLNRNEMKRDMETKRIVDEYLYSYVVYEGYLLIKEIERRNKAKGKDYVKSDLRHILAWERMQEKYKKYANKFIA